ncbi:hypothetical protein [Sinomonas albida]|uniref:hypothetical protein n=1 Tax=Sinomonas albida TaxID=369942 RepID=UPI001457D944|nr:hypothetical protein [Sinomonas albida]
MSQDHRPRVLRAQSSRVVAVFIWLACCALVVLLLSTGAADGLLRFGAWAALAAWVGFAVLWQPCIVLDADGMTMVNPLKTYRVPFAQVSDLKVGMTVAVEAAGRRYTSWGGPTPRGSFSAGREFQRRSQIQVLTPTDERLPAPSAVDPDRDSLRRAWEEAKRNPAAQSAALSARWNTLNIVGGIVCLLLIGAAAIR